MTVNVGALAPSAIGRLQAASGLELDQVDHTPAGDIFLLQARNPRRSARACQSLAKSRRAEELSNKRRGRFSPAVQRRLQCSCNAYGRFSATPNDSYFNVQRGLHQSNDFDIDAPAAWALDTGSRNTVVAVLDTGIDYNHIDLKANMWTNPGEIRGGYIGLR